MKAVYKKDLKSAFTGMIGWVLCAFVVVVVGLYFTAICLQSGYADFSLVLYNTTFIFLVVVPLLTMRSIVEERRQKTDQLLLTSRASIAGIVWGKYLALVTVYAIPLAIVGICPAGNARLRLGVAGAQLCGAAGVFSDGRGGHCHRPVHEQPDGKPDHRRCMHVRLAFCFCI